MTPTMMLRMEEAGGKRGWQVHPHHPFPTTAAALPYPHIKDAEKPPAVLQDL